MPESKAPKSTISILRNEPNKKEKIVKNNICIGVDSRGLERSTSPLNDSSKLKSNKIDNDEISVTSESSKGPKNENSIKRAVRNLNKLLEFSSEDSEGESYKQSISKYQQTKGSFFPKELYNLFVHFPSILIPNFYPG